MPLGAALGSPAASASRDGRRVSRVAMGRLAPVVTEASDDPNRAAFNDGLTNFSFRFLQKLRLSAVADNFVWIGRRRSFVEIR
jgi:hypothetical protein